jgi:hypothetical protein
MGAFRSFADIFFSEPEISQLDMTLHAKDCNRKRVASVFQTHLSVKKNIFRFQISIYNIDIMQSI